MQNEVLSENPGILFISDGSLTNPILSSQGIPLLEYLSSQNFRCFLLSFEKVLSEKGIELEEKYNLLLNYAVILTKTLEFITQAPIDELKKKWME